MLMISEEYERCWHLGGYMGQECELCPHRNECDNSKKKEKESNSSEETK